MFNYAAFIAQITHSLLVLVMMRFSERIYRWTNASSFPTLIKLKNDSENMNPFILLEWGANEHSFTWFERTIRKWEETKIAWFVFDNRTTESWKSERNDRETSTFWILWSDIFHCYLSVNSKHKYIEKCVEFKMISQTFAKFTILRTIYNENIDRKLIKHFWT